MAERSAGKVRWGVETSVPDPDREEVLALLRAAFPAVPLGEGVSLREARVIDALGTDAERAAARAADFLGPWTEAAHVLIDFDGGVFPFLDAAGFRHYLPAFVTRGLTDPTDAVHPSGVGGPAWAALDALLSALRFGRLPDFTAAQRAALAAFLRFMAAVAPDETIHDPCDDGEFVALLAALAGPAVADPAGAP